MKSIGWRFPPLLGGTRQGYTNNDIEAFKGENLLDNLTREICQNSLDARRENEDAPVKVVFERRVIRNRDFDVFTQYAECLKGCRRCWEDDMDAKLAKFVANAEDTLREENISILVVSDYGTKGLSGSHSRKKSSSWEALTGSDGVSVKSDGASGGSYGIGKNAPFACSSLSMVFYNTLTEDDESAFIGVARLATIFDDEDQETQRIGKYQVNDNISKEWTPIFPEFSNSFRDLFLRKKAGTDIIIVGFSQPSQWLTDVMKAVLKNFFVAISESKLVVELKDDAERFVINAESIDKIFSSFDNKNDMVESCQQYEAFVSPNEKRLFSVLEQDDVEIYFKKSSSFRKRTIANIRASGMLVGEYRVNKLQPYACVVVIRKKKLGELLKDTEPPSHKNWDSRRIEPIGCERQKEAENAINNVNRYVRDLLASHFEVVTESKVDAAGIGEYLPDDVVDQEEQSTGRDILKPKIRIRTIKKKKSCQGATWRPAVQSNGSEILKEVIVNNPHTFTGSKLNPYVPVDPYSNESEPKPGVAPGLGRRIVITPNIITQRAFAIRASQGLYKIVIKPFEDYNNMYVDCSALGEAGNPEPLLMETFVHNGKNVPISKGKAGPIQIKAELPAIFFVTFQRKEKMKLKLQLTEIVAK